MTFPPQQIVQDIVDSLLDAFSKNLSVLWLVSGGTAIETAVQARTILGNLPDTAILHVGLIDERYNVVGHKDSNYQKLLMAGFDTSAVTMHPVLIDGLSRDASAVHYNQTLQTLLAETDVSIGLLGIGADAHTAGILPDSILVSENSQLVGSYSGPDFERISTTPLLLSQLDHIMLYAVGESKWPAIEQFLTDGPVASVPARILKTAKALSLYTDYKKEKL